MKSSKSLLYEPTRRRSSWRRERGFIMSTCALTRRAAICAVGALALSPAAAVAQGPVRFRNVEVDVGPLRASEGDPTAAWVAETLPGQLVHALGPYLSPGARAGATLIARIDYLYLGPTSGGQARLARRRTQSRASSSCKGRAG